MTQPDPDLIKARDHLVKAYDLMGAQADDAREGALDLHPEISGFLAGLKAGRAEREEG